MDEWFFQQKDPNGWKGYPDPIDRRCYPNSSGRVVHIWGSQTLVGGEAKVVAGFATFGRLKVCEMLEFLRILYKHLTSDWVLLKARGRFFEAGEAGGQLLDFLSSVRLTKEEDIRLRPDNDEVVGDGHYIWFKQINGRRLREETPSMKTWPLTSRIVTAPGSATQSASGTATPNRSEPTRRERRTRDGRCRVTGKLALDRGEPRGPDWTALHCAHVLPLAWSGQVHMAKMFSQEALQLVKDLYERDLIDNTILMDARAHVWFDDYRFGIWPVREDGRWYGKIFRFEHGSCNVDGQWLLAAARPAKFPPPAHGKLETKSQREMREKDDQEREEDKTRCDLTNEPILREVLKVHFETCLHWHVKGMGWNK